MAYAVRVNEFRNLSKRLTFGNVRLDPKKRPTYLNIHRVGTMDSPEEKLKSREEWEEYMKHKDGAISNMFLFHENEKKMSKKEEREEETETKRRETFGNFQPTGQPISGRMAAVASLANVNYLHTMTMLLDLLQKPSGTKISTEYLREKIIMDDLEPAINILKDVGFHESVGVFTRKKTDKHADEVSNMIEAINLVTGYYGDFSGVYTMIPSAEFFRALDMSLPLQLLRKECWLLEHEMKSSQPPPLLPDNAHVVGTRTGDPFTFFWSHEKPRYADGKAIPRDQIFLASQIKKEHGKSHEISEVFGRKDDKENTAGIEDENGKFSHDLSAIITGT
eukprot:TRINITY_DN8068_c0_g1_i1.p1 TRINITY_DN8068_c0_g1~~TRINITY_DN8068_c0_g1_i1.p1  ORF type:complete len:335 (-),score=62.10 TRINITY_DN8068_c0_g1_i1:145-1149(-)